MTIDAFVFDAYGTLYDVHSVYEVTSQEFPDHGELITQVWRLKQLEYTWLRSQMQSYRSFWEISEESLVFTLKAIGLDTDKDVIDRIMEVLDALVKNTGLDSKLQAVISVDQVRTFKPNPKAYELVEKTLNVKPENVMFVSSNSFDATGAKHFGFQVSWIERVTPQALASEIASSNVVDPTTMFKILRMQMENFDLEPDHRLSCLSDLSSLIN